MAATAQECRSVVVVTKTFLEVRSEFRPLRRTQSWPSLHQEMEAFALKDMKSLKASWDKEQKKNALAEKEACHREGRCFPCLFFTRKGLPFRSF